MGLSDPVSLPSAVPLDDYAEPIAALRLVELERNCALRAGLPAGLWTLSRVTPRGGGHALVRYVHAEGREVIGQWFADPTAHAQAVRATRRTAWSADQVVVLSHHQLLWQLGGVDRKLPHLAALCQAGAALIVHHPEQRAVVRLASGSHYAKVVRPVRAAPLAEKLRRVQAALAGRGPRTPDVVAVNPAAGLVMTATLPGRSLLAWLGDDACTVGQLAHLGRQAGAAVAALHQSALPRTALYDAHAAAQTLVDQLQRLGWVAPRLSAYLDHWRPARQAALLAGDPDPYVPLHRDCYDKQFIGSPDDAGAALGLLDFDTLTWGEAGLDVANFLVHCDLRAWQERCTPARAVLLAAAFVQGYGPEALRFDRLQAYADAVRLRLACVYGCRPPQRGLVTRLVESIGAPVTGLG